MNTFILRGALGASALVACSHIAAAHAVLERREAQANAVYRGVVQITHGCEQSPTVTVRVTIPEGAIGARPMVKPGWTITAARGPYARAYPYLHGATIAEGVKEITWTGSSLPADQFDEFIFSVRLTDGFAPGQSVYFPVEQVCASGSHRWVEIPAAGQDAHALAKPAPFVRVMAAATATAAEPAPVTKVGTLVVERPWMRATPGGAKVAGGYVRITNTGTQSDRLVAASVPLAGRGEIHEMLTEAGIMKMRPVEGGLEIKPGQSVELRPGGYHLMFMDLTAGVKEGERVRGTLVFEKAGPVEVIFAVAGLGARAPEPGSAHH
ncbi:copper chaperone PCu(A)C [uncultured Enterovirga sp.]|uniref:copper chaperone PCu(A)C n=1 Tax=uncultured Enterovirga sp. TaxID=2026352 RepID=UPI0035CC9785